MNSRSTRVALAFACAGVMLLQTACSDLKSLTSDDLITSATLVAHYVTPGNGTQPCDDLAPIVDGVYFDYEWRDAEPLVIQMTGVNGNGGPDFTMELRAVWSDGRRAFGQIDRDRLYMMFRWGDPDMDRDPDLLAYGRPHPLTGEIIPSPMPRNEGSSCDVDSVLRNERSWTRLNADGAEDQLLVMIKEVDEDLAAVEGLADQTKGLVDLNAEVFEILGPKGLDIDEKLSHATGPMDVWLWRAGRTNAHPVYQRSKWESYESFKRWPFGPDHATVVDVPQAEFSIFPNFSGFFQDFEVTSDLRLKNDSGLDPKGLRPLSVFVQNFADGGTKPLFLTHPDPRVGGRGDGSQFDGFVLNGSLPVDQVMWDEQKWLFSPAGCDVIVPTRGEKNSKWWSEKLLQDGLDFDKQFGWAIRTPSGSRKDVRGKGEWNTLTDKIEPTWTVELQRELDAKYPDDLDLKSTKRYILSLAVADGSGRICSGSYPIILTFQPRYPQEVAIDEKDKCQP